MLKRKWIPAGLLLGFLLVLIAFALVQHGTEKEVSVTPDYYTNKAGVLSAEIFIRSGFSLPMIVSVGTSITASIQSRTDKNQIFPKDIRAAEMQGEESQRYFKTFGSGIGGYHAACRVPPARWRIRFWSVETYQVRLGRHMFNLPPRTNIVTTKELPSSTEVLKGFPQKIRFEPND